MVATTLFVTPARAADEPIGSFTAGGSVNQVYTYGHAPGVEVQLVTASDAQVQVGVTDAQGAFLFKNVAKATGYRVKAAGERSEPLTVTDFGENPPASFYDGQPDLDLAQAPGTAKYGYLTTRDGTKLSVSVSFPDTNYTKPRPVVVNYTGYDSSKPSSLRSEVIPYRLLGYIVVGVNMRGSGCSGGAFDFFEPPQSTDGYDVIETIARQPWSNGDVGMVGISYGGYSQLYVGATNPPHLRALTVLSPYDDTYGSILYPGGILNSGFAVNWAEEREEATRPFPTTEAEAWVREQIDGGDTQCEQNQVLRLQNADLSQMIDDNRFVTDGLDYLNTKKFVDKIRVPTYLGVQFQDEQTGGHAASLFELFDPDTEVQAAFTNGTHADAVGPAEFLRSFAFIDFYVGKRVPSTKDVTGKHDVRDAISVGLAGTFGRPGDPWEDLKMPANPWEGVTDYDTALRWFEAAPPVRIVWENGAVEGKENLPYGTAETHATSWPIPQVVPEPHYLQPDGALKSTSPSLASTAARARSSYRYDPSTKAPRTFEGGIHDAWRKHPDVTWKALPEGDALSFETEPYASSAAYAGTASVDLWLRSNAADTDLETTLTEVRPDGTEVFIQSGWLRASHRKLDSANSTELSPAHTYREADAEPLPRGTFAPMRIEVFPFAHVVRAGSRLRLNIEAPNGNLPSWSFDALEPAPVDGGAEVRNEIGHATMMPSRVVLPRLPDRFRPKVPVTPPSCKVPGVTTAMQSLRNQPCRSYVAPRIPTGVTASALPSGDIGVSWTAPAGPDVPTGYVVEAIATGEAVEVAADATTATVARPAAAVRHEFTVRARYGDVLGPASNASPVLKTQPLPLAPGEGPPVPGAVEPG